MTAGIPVVPWVTAWSAEVVDPRDVLLRPGLDRVRYVDEELADYRYGVLWTRERDARGEGEPVWRDVHARRQREAISGPRCQVCGTQLPRENVPWLLPRGIFEELAGQKNLTITPPTCEACWPVAEARCPHIRRATPARLHVANTLRWGVMGDLYHPLQRVRGIWVPFQDKPTLSHVVARQLVVQLGDYEEIQ